MIKVYADFNARTKDGACFILSYNDVSLDREIPELDLLSGSKVILYQDKNDFEVEAILKFEYVDVLDRAAWVAYPDWTTMVRNKP